MRHSNFLAACAVLVLIATPVMADPPADKGKGNDQSMQQGHGQGQDQGQGQGQGKKGDADYRYDAGDKSKGDKSKYDNSKGESNHGQVVSACNHRANERNMKGQERKQWVEWCVERGERYAYDDGRWNTDRSCYRYADNRNLTGDERKRYLRDCLAKRN